MINQLIDAVCMALSAEFGDGYKIYTDAVEQGLTEPCFAVRCISPADELFRGNRHFMTNQFCVHYFPASAEKETESNAVSEELFFALETIETADGGLVRGTDMHAELNDGVLSFFVNYNLYVYKETEEETAMEDIELNQSVTEEG